MPTLTLREIANQMYASLASQPTDAPAVRCHHPLSHGLHIVLERNADDWLLKLGCQKVYPSELGIVLCKRAYRLADDHPDARMEPTADGWHVVAIRWQGGIPAPKGVTR